MEIEILFKIAAIGILVSVLNAILNKSGREEQAMMITLAGLILVLLMVIKEIANLFDTIKTMFQF
jgi:stage III sporulation protein AC